MTADAFDKASSIVVIVLRIDGKMPAAGRPMIGWRNPADHEGVTVIVEVQGKMLAFLSCQVPARVECLHAVGAIYLNVEADREYPLCCRQVEVVELRRAIDAPVHEFGIDKRTICRHARHDI